MSPRKAQKIAVFLIIVIVVGIFVLYSSKLSNEPISPKEVRVFVALFFLLFLFLIIILSLVRNAMVMNTAFLIKVKDALHKQGRSMEGVERALIENTKHLMEGNRIMKNEKYTETPKTSTKTEK